MQQGKAVPIEAGIREKDAPQAVLLTPDRMDLTWVQDTKVRRYVMSTIKTKDGREIYYKDWGKGPAVTFSHGWPLNSDAWDGQMLFLAQKGFRVVAHDRRGHGRSQQVSSGNDMDSYADDLAAVIEKLDLRNVTLVGHSTGGGEVARYIGRHGTKRVAKAVLIAAVPPLMLKTPANPMRVSFGADELGATSGSPARSYSMATDTDTVDEP